MITLLGIFLLVLAAWYAISEMIAFVICRVAGIDQPDAERDLRAGVLMAPAILGLVALAYAMQWVIRKLHAVSGGILPDADDNAMEYLL